MISRTSSQRILKQRKLSSTDRYNAHLISSKSKSKIRQTIKSAFGRQLPSKQYTQQKVRNLRSCNSSKKSLKSENHRSQFEYEEKANILHRINQKKHLMLDQSNRKLSKYDKYSVQDDKIANSNPKNTKNIVKNGNFFQRQLRQSKQSIREQIVIKPIIDKYEWWHHKNYAIHTQDKVKGTQFTKQYLRYFAYSEQQSNKKVKKVILTAFENDIMYPGHSELIIYGISSEQNKPLQIQQLAYQAKMKIDCSKFDCLLICSPNQEKVSFINIQLLKKIIQSYKQKQKDDQGIDQLIDKLAKKKIQDDEGAAFYLFLTINKRKMKQKYNKNQLYKSPYQSRKKQIREISKQALLKVKKRQIKQQS